MYASGRASAAAPGGAMLLMLMLMDSPMPGLQIGGIAKTLAWRHWAAPACPYVLHVHIICNIDKKYASGRASAAAPGGAMVLMLMLMDSPMPGLQTRGIAKRLARR